MDLLTKTRLSKIGQLSNDILRGGEATRTGDLSVWRAIRAAATGQYKRAAPREFDHWGMVEENPQRFEIPFEHLTRDLSGGTAGAGGFLTSTDVGPVELPLVGAGVVRAGASVTTGISSGTVFPKITTKPIFSWLATEGSQLPNDSTMALAQTAAQIKRGGINLRVSRQMTLQSETDVDIILTRLLTQLGNDAIDIGVLNGSGSLGEPTGLLQTAGVVNVTGTGLNMPGLAQMEEACLLADADDARVSWFSAPGVRRILRPREIAAGSGTVWPGKDLLGHPAYVTTKTLPASLVVGDFHNINILLFGRGIEVLVNPYADFKSGRVEFQLFIGMDVVIHFPASFAKAVTIT